MAKKRFSRHCLEYETPSIKDAADLCDAPEEEKQKYRDAAIVMPYVREIEVRAIGEAAVRMQRESDDGVSLEPENISLSAATLKSIDREIASSNKQGGGRITRLRRSQIRDDPQQLERSPDWLPNPKLWRDRIASAPTGDPKTWSPRQKKDKDDAKEAQQRLIAFQTGTSKIATTAAYAVKVCSNSGDSNIRISHNNNIFVATNNFQRHCITQREINWYNSIDSSAKIFQAQEQRVANAEANTKPWKLLDLPEFTPEQVIYQLHLCFIHLTIHIML